MAQEKDTIEVLLIPTQVEGLLKNEKSSGQQMAKAFSKQIEEMIDKIEKIEVNSKESANILADLLVKGRAGFNSLDSMRKKFYEPYKTSIDNINDYWKRNFKTDEFKELLDLKKKELMAFEKEEKAKADKLAAEEKRKIEEKAREDIRKFQLFEEMQQHFQMIIDALINCDTGKDLTEVFHQFLNPNNTEVIAKKDFYSKYWKNDYDKLYANAKEVGKKRAEEIKNSKPVSEEIVIKQQEIIKEQQQRQEEIDDEKLDGEINIAKAIKKIDDEKPTSNTYERFTWEGIIDKTMNEVDHKFLELSITAIDEYIKKNKVNLVEGAVIGGIRFIKRSTTVLKG